MVISCSSYGCTNRQEKGCGIQFHRFPLKRPFGLSKWIHEMKRKNFKPSEYSYLCSEHFTNEDYQIRPGANVKWLKDEAVPSIFKEFSQHLQKKKVVRRLLKRNPLATIIMINYKVQKVLKIIVKVFSVPYNHQQRQLKKKKVKVLQQRLKRRETKIKSLKSLVMRFKKNVPMSDDVTTQLEEHFGGIPLALLLHERKTKKIGKNAIRYSDSMKEFAKTLFFYSPRAYNVQLGEYTGEILDYIAGYIVRSICKKLVCPFCVSILLSSQSDHNYTAELVPIFARFEILSVLKSDGDRQHTSQQFKQFAKDFDMELVNSFPVYVQSNGMVERAIQTVKKMLSKALEDGLDWNKCLIEYRNTGN
ncbi:hypothetical protein ACI65C_004983 [Semiaphis heraclei]